MESATAERWWFVVGGEPGLALSFLFGDEFGSLASFSGDPLASILFAGCLRRGIITSRSGVGSLRVASGSSPVDWASAGNMLAPWGSVA